MKTALSFFIFVTIVYGFSIQSYAQNTGSAAVFATIVTSTTIERTDGQGFNSQSIKPADTAMFSREDTSRLNSNITHIQKPGIIALAEFLIKGEDLSSFSITLPQFPVSLTQRASTETIQVDSFINSTGTIGALSKGAHTLLISGNVDYKPGQPGGIYHSPPVHITVNYN